MGNDYGVGDWGDNMDDNDETQLRKRRHPSRLWPVLPSITALTLMPSRQAILVSSQHQQWGHSNPVWAKKHY